MNINTIRKQTQGILMVGCHPRIIQSILDFDHISGKSEPSIVGCITATRKAAKFFFGSREVVIPCYPEVTAFPKKSVVKVQWMLNVRSGRQALESTIAFFDAFPNALGGHIFAENVPERHATELIERFGKKKLLLGPAGVGFLVPRSLKLGAIGGVDVVQLEASKLTTVGSIAVVSTSGGMTNELIRSVIAADKRLSFAISIGGDRFPVASLADVLLLAEADPQTSAIVYFGELGGVDEYEIVDLVQSHKLTKPILAYVAGIIDDVFADRMQFGHAKALVAHPDESASAKRKALRDAGVQAPDTFLEFIDAIRQLPSAPFHDDEIDSGPLLTRRGSILSTKDFSQHADTLDFVRGSKLVRDGGEFTRATLQALLGAKVRSRVTTAFVENIFIYLMDHGGHVSGAVNTMITARAGKDMVASLSAGLLTIGPRFGGAVNAAAEQWFIGHASGVSAEAFVKERTRGGALLAGVGHRKYRLGLPDPRVTKLAQFTRLLDTHPYYDFACAVEKITTAKHGSLMLNIDGVIAALMLDILHEHEGFSDEQLRELIDAEFFNAFFVIPRSVGFIAHFIEQKRRDEGLFRLPDDLLFIAPDEG